MTITRRRFLAVAGGGTVAGVWARWLHDPVRVDPGGAAADRVLVVVQCNGGNDGLNTLVPTDGRYRDLRPTIGVPEDDLLAVPGDTAWGLHPSLAPLLPLWEQGRVAAVQSIGFEGAGRSHFQALDTWWTARPGRPSTTGWLGRWLDATVGDGASGGPLRAVALGGGSPVLRAGRAVATVVTDPGAFVVVAPRRTDPGPFVEALLATAEPPSPVPMAAAAQRAVPAALDAVARFAAVTDPGGEPPEPGEGAGTVTASLRVAADLVTGGVGTRLVVVSAGGFDTHADQPPVHAALLADLAGGVAELFATLAARGADHRAMVVTTSEFGRRVAENGSDGTDHGAGNVQLAVGPGVAGGVVGDADLARLVDGDLRPAVDPRALYGAALAWLGGPVDEVLDGEQEDLGILR